MSRSKRLLIFGLIVTIPALALMAVNRWRSIPEPPTGIYLTEGGQGLCVFKLGLGGYIKVADSDLRAYLTKDDHLLVEPLKWNSRNKQRRPYSEYARSTRIAGDWDLIRISQSVVGARGSSQKERIFNPPVASALHRLDDSRLIELFHSSDFNPSLLRELLQAHADDPFLRALYLQSLSWKAETSELDQKLSLWKESLQNAPNPNLQIQYRRAVRQAKGTHLSEQGLNAYDFVTSMTYQNPSQPGWDLEQTIQRLPEIMKYEQCIIPDSARRNFADQTTRIRTLSTVSIFLMMQGKRHQAFDLIDCMYHWTRLSGNYDARLESYVGEIMASFVTGRLQIFLENCCETREQCQNAMARLNEIKPSAPDPIAVQLLQLCRSASASISESELDIISAKAANADTAFDLARATVAARDHLISTGAFPAMETEFAPLLPQGLPPDRFSPRKNKLKFIPGSEPFLIYSIGPDKKDDLAKINYDPSNGAFSRGDMLVDLPREREFPFPPEGTRANSKDDLLRQYPNGLPLDVFGDNKGKQLCVTNTRPVKIYSVGPDRDLKAARKEDVNEVSVAYDPTNGTMSSGDLFLTIPAK